MMRLSKVIQYAAKERNLKSLALTVHFKHPYGEIDQEWDTLCRGSAYLLSVDAKDKAARMSEENTGPYDHLEASEERREEREFKQTFGRSRVTRVVGRKEMDIGWLEFVPREVRPRAHIVCSSHVVAPFLWKEYYPYDWLSPVRQEHCKYSLGIYDTDQQVEALATIEVNSRPFHHPEGRDIALLHFIDEEQALDTLREHGVKTLYMRDHAEQYQKGEVIDFDGFVVAKPDAVDSTSNEYVETEKNEEDLSTFFNYRETGILSFHTEDRFFAKTAKVLPQGMCGAPATDDDGDVCGTVEGVVPVAHENKEFAGAAAFIPSFVMQVFIDYVERTMIQDMMPIQLFEMIKTIKSTNTMAGGLFRRDESGKFTKPTQWDVEHERAMTKLKNNYKKDEIEKIMDVIDSQRDEVMKIFNTEGGDMDMIIEKVRAKKEHLKALVQDKFRKFKPK